MGTKTNIAVCCIAILLLGLLDLGATLLNKAPSVPAGSVHGAAQTDGTASAEADHKHRYAVVRLRETSCAEGGEACFCCITCGASYTEPITDGKHRFRVEQVVNENGRPEPHHVCAICGTDADACPAPFDAAQQEKLTGIFRKYGAVSAQVALIRDGAVTEVFAYGTAETESGRITDTDTKYRVASITKLATFLVFMTLQDRGLVDENEDISTYFGYTCRNPRYPDDSITPAMLMTHTAGFAIYGDPLLSRGDLSYSDLYYDIRPGSAYSYSNTGAALVACVCENAAGRCLDDLAKEYLFGPLGIDAAFHASDLKDQTNIAALYGEDGGLSVISQLSTPKYALGAGLNLAAGNLTVSAKDYAKLIAMLINDGRNAADETVLSKASVASVLDAHIMTDGYGVGYGVELRDNIIGEKTFYTHTGSAWGMFSAFAFCKEDRCGVVVLTSGCDRWEDPETEMYRVCLEAINTVYPTKTPVDEET